MRALFVSATLAASILAGAAVAQTTATAATDLNMRSGPANTSEVVGVIANGAEVSVAGCEEISNWCRVAHDGQEGWAHGDYLSTPEGQEIPPLPSDSASAGASIPAAASAGAGGALFGPPPEIRTFIADNPQQPVLLEGDLVIGAGVPENVTLHEIPDQPGYRYVTINGQPVLVNPENRQIVHIYR